MAESSPSAWRRVARAHVPKSVREEGPEHYARRRAAASFSATDQEPGESGGQERVGQERGGQERVGQEHGGRALVPAKSTALASDRVSPRKVVADFTLVMVAAPVLGLVAAVAMLGLGREFAERLSRPTALVASPAEPAQAPQTRLASPEPDQADPAPQPPAPGAAPQRAARQTVRLHPVAAFGGQAAAAAEARARPLAIRTAFSSSAIIEAPASAQVLGREADARPELPAAARAALGASGSSGLSGPALGDAEPNAAALSAADARPTAPEIPVRTASRDRAAPGVWSPRGLKAMMSTAAIDRAPAEPYEPDAGSESGGPVVARNVADAPVVAETADIPDVLATMERAQSASEGPSAPAEQAAEGPADPAPGMIATALALEPSPQAGAAAGVEEEPEGFGVAPTLSLRPSPARWGVGVAPHLAAPPSKRRVRQVRARAPRAAEAPSPRPDGDVGRAEPGDPAQILRRMRDGSL